MNTFIRYFIHYIGICIIIIVALGTIGIFNKLPINRHIAIALICSLFLFSSAMAAVITNVSAKLVTVKISYNNEEDKAIYLEKLDKYIVNEAKRTEKSEVYNNTYTYQSSFRYIKWLTNEMKVTVYPNIIEINTPKAYAKKIKNK